MRVIIALAVLAMFLPLGGCARKYQTAYAKPVHSAPGPHTMKAKAMKPAQKPAAPMPSSPNPARGKTHVVEGTETEAKFKAAQAKAAKVGIENLTKEDIGA